MNSLIFLFLILKSKSQIYTLYETSENEINYSDTLSELEYTDYHMSRNSFIVSYYSDLIEADQIINNQFSFFQQNCDFGTGYPLFFSLIKDTSNLGENISISFSHSNNIFYSELVVNKKINHKNYDNFNPDLEVNCSFIEMTYDPNLEKIGEIDFSFSKFEFFLKFTFGLSNGDVYYFIDYIKDKVLIERNDCQGYINNFFFSENNYNNNNKEGYLFFYISENKEICVYSLLFTDNSFKISFQKKINEINNNVLDIKIYDNYIYYSLKDNKSITRININDINDKINYNYSNIQNDFISFIICEETIYAIEENKGLLIFDKEITNESFRSFNFTKAVKLDYFMNAFTGYKFIGLYLNNTDNINSDFFIEFILINEKYPEINKALLYPEKKKLIINQILTFDYFFTYIYDNLSKQLIMIKRGSLNRVPFISFKLSLKNRINFGINIGQTINSFIFPIYHDNKIHLGFLEDQFYYILKGNFSNGNLICSFKNTGLFTLVFMQYSDFCVDFINDNEDNYCKNLVTYRFSVLEKKKNNLTRNLIIVLIVIIISAIIVILLLVRYRKRIREGKMTVSAKFNKNDRKHLYETKNDINNKNNFKNQNIGELKGSNEPFINNENQFGGLDNKMMDKILKRNKKRIEKGYDPFKQKINEKENNKNNSFNNNNNNNNDNNNNNENKNNDNDNNYVNGNNKVNNFIDKKDNIKFNETPIQHIQIGRYEKKNIDLISSANSNSNLGENNEKNKNNDNSIN